MEWELFTKRTNYPKLSWLIEKLNDAGISNKVDGDSRDAPLLYVDSNRVGDAWGILIPFDDVDDDSPMFSGYEGDDEFPDPRSSGWVGDGGLP